MIEFNLYYPQLSKAAVERANEAFSDVMEAAYQLEVDRLIQYCTIGCKILKAHLEGRRKICVREITPYNREILSGMGFLVQRLYDGSYEWMIEWNYRISRLYFPFPGLEINAVFKDESIKEQH